MTFRRGPGKTSQSSNVRKLCILTRSTEPFRNPFFFSKWISPFPLRYSAVASPAPSIYFPRYLPIRHNSNSLVIPSVNVLEIWCLILCSSALSLLTLLRISHKASWGTVPYCRIERHSKSFLKFKIQIIFNYGRPLGSSVFRSGGLADLVPYHSNELK